MFHFKKLENLSNMIQLVNNSLWSELPKIQSKLSSHEVSEVKRRKRGWLGPYVFGLWLDYMTNPYSFHINIKKWYLISWVYDKYRIWWLFQVYLSALQNITANLQTQFKALNSDHSSILKDHKGMDQDSEQGTAQTKLLIHQVVSTVCLRLHTSL